jgi:hypothetical protein
MKKPGSMFVQIGCIVALLFVFSCPNALGSGGAGTCPTGGTLWTNLTGDTTPIDLSLTVGPIQTGTGMVTLNWTDGNGVKQAITVVTGQSTGVSTSLPAGGIVIYNCNTGTSVVHFSWQVDVH